MKKSELKSLIKECVRELVSEVLPGRDRQYPSSESRIFDSIVSIIAKDENEQPLDHKKFKSFKLKDKDIYVFDAPKKIFVFDANVSADKSKSDGKITFKNGNISNLQNLLKSLVNVNEINGTPEYSHENYGMLEADGVDSELMKYTVSYKLYKNGAAIRDRKNVEVYGPDFGTAESDKKKFLEDKVYALEIASVESSKGRNKEITPISGTKPTVSDGELKVVGLVVTSVQQTPKPSKLGPAFDAETVKKLSAPLAPGSRVD